MKINSVLGAIDTAELGVTYMHEHIINIEWNFARAFSDWYDREVMVAEFCQEAEILKSYGLKTFVDATPINLGRDVELMKECARKSGLNILACTGVYWQEQPFFADGVDANVLADLILREINEGMEGTDVKPAFVKCATEAIPGKSEANKNMIKAAAIAAKESGLPVYTHADPTTDYGLYQLEILTNEGINPEKIAIGHAGGGGLDYISALISRGAYVGLDQLGFYGEKAIHSVAEAMPQILAAIGSERIFLSTDMAVRSDFARALLPDLKDRKRNIYTKKGSRYIVFDTLLPAMRDAGVNEKHIENMLLNNARRYFEAG